MLPASAFAAVEAGIESGAGIWGFVFLTAGRGLPHEAPGVALSAYWATMWPGAPGSARSPSASGRRGSWPGRAGVTLGGVLLTAGARVLAVARLVTLGLSAAPIFPLLTLTTAPRAGADVTAACRSRLPPSVTPHCRR